MEQVGEGDDCWSGPREAEWLRNWTPLAVDYGEYDPLRAGSIDGTDTTPHDRGIVRAMRSNRRLILETSILPLLTIFT